ncbi:uncharacterized protein C8Q71DRAFT_74392 [Rhodofomes roseus]|uniref:Uncharacterized protein n=1 Tax=Rhodofomes roseus TaxID=34475 RepID=A0A4Y9Y268_9APHY|nr:uncharacterized protein C8Q71DRAFT_74392 [Rhodofomes roseus]KAH9836265.1 hypothetical protein C8Q71DRAFT_74392 [Rhodofomes roseus]TFY55677.1 hypothetical protein EVJ58_g8104 [Rhodofomes roseus]
MSTTTSSSAATATQTGNDGGIGNSTEAQNGQLPFSFLMTFIAVFVFIIGCGFGTRRLSIELRRAVGNAAGQCRSSPLVPELWDVVPRKACQTAMGKFYEFLPLSVAYVREEKHDPTTELPSSSTPPVQIPELPRGYRILEFVPFVSIYIAVRTLRRMRQVQAATAAGTFNPSLPEAPPPPVRAVNVSVLIAMPSPYRPNPRYSQSSSSYSKDIADYSIPSLAYSSEPNPTGLDEEWRNSSVSTGKKRDSGFPGSFEDEDEDAASGEFAIGVVQVPWDSDEVDLMTPRR